MGTQVTVTNLPSCDFHDGKHDAEYDFKTDPRGPGRGQWGNGCQQAFDDFGIKLGTGYGQKLIVAKDGE